MPGAARELADRIAGRLFRTPQNLLRQFADVLESTARAHCVEPLVTDLAAGALRRQVAEDRIRRAHVPADDPMQRVIGLTALVQLEHRDPKSLLVDVARSGADPVTDDIGVVDG